MDNTALHVKMTAFVMRALQLSEDLPEELKPAVITVFFEITFKDLFLSKKGV